MIRRPVTDPSHPVAWLIVALLALCAPGLARAQTSTRTTAGIEAQAPTTPAKPAAHKPAGITLSLPVAGGYDLQQSGSNRDGIAARLKAAPVPDPSTLPPKSDSLHDPATGTDLSRFGTAYTYPNPNNDTTSGLSVGDAASKSAGLPSRGGGGLVVLQWGYPPRPMPKVPGEDLTAAPPPVPVIHFAVQANDGATLDDKSIWTVERAVLAYGRANLVEITIERPADRPDCCRGFAALVRAELIREGVGPDDAHLLPDHRMRVILATLPVAR